MSTKKSPSRRAPSSKKTDAKLVRENKELKFERDGSLEREAATSDILRMIARSPTDLQSVLDGIAERAARLCDAEDAAIFRLDGNFLRLVAHFGPIPIAGKVGESGRVLDRGTPLQRIIDRQTIHIHDLPAADAEFPEQGPESQWASLRRSTHRYSAKASPLVLSTSETKSPSFLRQANQIARNLC